MLSRTSSPTVLLVDGYNVIGAWAALKQIRDRDGLEPARWQLIEVLINYSSYKGFETQIIFDAYYQNRPSTQEVITQNLSIHYTNFGQTADSFIEIACAKFRNDIRKFHQRLMVATSDKAQQMTVIGYGAEWMSALQLANEVEAIANRVRRKQSSSKKSSSRFLAKSLDPLAQQHLAKLRMGLKP